MGTVFKGGIKMMSVLMQKLVKAVCPDFPEDREVRETHDRMSWYMIGNTPPILRVPPADYLKKNTFELDRFAEAVQSFATYDASSSEYDWEDLFLIDYKGIECIDGLEELKAVLERNPSRVAVDIETRRVEYEDNILLSIGFAISNTECWAFHNIPIRGARYEGPDLSPATCYRVYQLLNSCLNIPDVTYIWHNGKFDVNRLKYLCNIDARIDEDTMLKHYACINEKRGTHGLKDLGQLYLQAPAWDDELDQLKRDWCKDHKCKLADFMYDYIPTSTLIPYMQRDCIATYRLLEKFEKLERPGSDFVYRMLIKASKVYGQLELNGMKVDLDYLEDYEFELDMDIQKANTVLAEVSSRIWNVEQYKLDTKAKSADAEFNIKSPKQLKWMLKQVLGYDVETTDAQMLNTLNEECEKGYITNPLAKDFIESIMSVRKSNKYMDTYVQGVRNVVCRDGRVRCTYNLHGTETGRLSCSDPNMQNIPRNKKVKNIFAAADGYKLLQLDYSQAELRVLAMLSNDPFMISSYQAGKDFHDAVAEKMFGPDFDKEQRNMAKTINFGIAYGRGPSSIAENFGKTMSEARQIIEDWFRPMPSVKQYINSQRKKPTSGEPCVTMLGRERHFVITDEKLNHIQNEYINTPIQSLASDFTMLSLIGIHEYLEENKLDARIVATVHDSIILEVQDDKQLIDTVAENCVKIMAETPKKFVPDCQVPFKADAEVGYSWGALEEWVM